MKTPQTFVRTMASRATTLVALFRYFTTGKRIFMFPILVLILITGVLLLFTGGLSYVAPFVYTIF